MVELLYAFNLSCFARCITCGILLYKTSTLNDILEAAITRYLVIRPKVSHIQCGAEPLPLEVLPMGRKLKIFGFLASAKTYSSQAEMK